ncbi:MAG: alkaline phosphatase family protein [Phycisphaerales bacterium]
MTDPTPSRPPNRRAKRLLLVGWDAADWMMIEPLLTRGAMPRLKRLLDAGSRADLASSLPRLSPLLWSTIATGKTPDRHGILNFVEPDPDPASATGVRLSSSTTRRVKAIWNILTQSSLRVNVVGWYASHPAEPISGTCVSNMLQEGEPAKDGEAWPLPPGAIHPASESERLAACRVASHAIARSELLKFIPKLAELPPGDPRPRALAKQLARTASVHRAAKAILDADHEWDCTMVFYEGIDTIGHHFMEYFPPRMAHVSDADVRRFGEVMPATYRLHDRMLGELLDAAGPDTTVLLLSDHGFHSDHRRPAITADLAKDRAALEASWHREHGVLVLSGPGVGHAKTIHAPKLVDIAPTALALLGVPVAKDLDGRPLAEAFEPATTSAELPAIESWEAVDGDAGLHPPDLRLDPFEAHDALQQLVDLGYMAELPQDRGERLDLVRRETRYNLAITHATNRRPAQAADVLAELHREQPAELRYAEALVTMLRDAGRPSEALPVVQSILERHPDRVEARLQLVATRLELDDRAGADEAYLRAREIASDRMDLQIALGELAATLDRFPQAESHFKEALAHDPSPAVHLGFARLALRRGRHEQAAEHALDALEAQPHLPEGNLLLGTALAWLEAKDDARRCLDLAAGQGLVEAMRFLLALDLAEGDVDSAARRRTTLQAAITKLPPRVASTIPPYDAGAWAKAKGIELGG